MSRTLRLLVLGAAALLLGLPASASAAQPQCGEVVTTDVTLEADLLACPGDGLVVAAPDVTIDLNSFAWTAPRPAWECASRLPA